MRRKDDEAPPIAGDADLEREAKLDAERVTLEFKAPITTAVAQRSIEGLPLFSTGREEQGELWCS